MDRGIQYKSDSFHKLSPMYTTQLLCLINTTLVVGSMLKDRYYDIQSPYGRFTNAAAPTNKFEWKVDQPIPARTAWLLFESPNLVLGFSIVFWAWRTNSGTPVGWLVTWMFLSHYVARTFVYSLLIKGAKPMPLLVLACSLGFTMINGWVQTYHHLFEYEDGHYAWIRVPLGLSIFLLGVGINHYCDAVLRGLRKNDGDTNYYIPTGLFFDQISASNLMGEIIEWFGYFVCAGTWVSFGFALATAAIVGNRAIGTHAWYKQKFGDKYPKGRRALFPF